MYTQWYEQISAPFRKNAAAVKAIGFLDKALVALVAVAYFAALASLFAAGDARFARAVAVPAVGFVAATAVRAAINAPRPYEAYPIDPLIKKDTHGKSLPSRHIFSAVIIACTLWWLNPVWGALACVMCVLVGFCRIVGGVHFPRDIVTAFLFAFVCAAIGFILIP